MRGEDFFSPLDVSSRGRQSVAVRICLHSDQENQFGPRSSVRPSAVFPRWPRASLSVAPWDCHSQYSSSSPSSSFSSSSGCAGGINIQGDDENVDLHLVARHPCDAPAQLRPSARTFVDKPTTILAHSHNQNPFERRSRWRWRRPSSAKGRSQWTRRCTNAELRCMGSRYSPLVYEVKRTDGAQQRLLRKTRVRATNCRFLPGYENFCTISNACPIWASSEFG